MEKGNWNTDPPFNANSYAYIQDFNIGSLSVGQHTIKIIADSDNSVSENNESDNEYTKFITIASPPTFPLSVSTNGSGVVTSTPTGINCPSNCISNYSSGSSLILTATPTSGWVFSGWSGGGCSGTGNCQVIMNSAQAVTANFTQQLPTYALTVSSTGSGTVTSQPAGINCPPSCTGNYNSGTPVTLTATPASGWMLSGWGGACSSTGLCPVIMNSTKSVIATFLRQATTVSAANYAGGEQAAESIVSAFGLQLSSITQAAPSLPLPFMLGGSQVLVKDSKGGERPAPLFYVSPGQLNFQIPKDTAEGIATVTVLNGGVATNSGLVIIGKVSPALFSANSTGSGFAAASALHVRADGSRNEEVVARFDTGQNKFVAVPIDLGAESEQVFLTLYGTGLKNRSGLANVKVKIGGVDVPADYAGAQGFFVGLDQVNVKIPRSLIGRGEVNLELIVDGKAANVLKAAVK